MEKIISDTHRSDLNFGHALHLLLAGKKVARIGWIERKRFLYYSDIQRCIFMVNYQIEGAIDLKKCDKYIGYDGEFFGFSKWMIEQPDILSNDWCVIE